MAQNPLAVRWPPDDPVVREIDLQIALLQERTLADDDSPDDLVKRRLDYVGIRTIWQARHELRRFRQILCRLFVLESGTAHGGTVRRGISLRLLCLLLVASSDDASEQPALRLFLGKHAPFFNGSPAALARIVDLARNGGLAAIADAGRAWHDATATWPIVAGKANDLLRPIPSLS